MLEKTYASFKKGQFYFKTIENAKRHISAMFHLLFRDAQRGVQAGKIEMEKILGNESIKSCEFYRRLAVWI